MYFNNLEYLLSIIYPKLTWARKTEDKVIYLTFDDGPIPEITDYVLKELDVYKAKATFFCVGDNVSKYPDVFLRIIEKGHKVGNHTFHHLNGWKNDTEYYLENVKLSEDKMFSCINEEQRQSYTSNTTGKKLFRPPYGKIRKSQIRKLNGEYEIIMWDVLTGDFDKNLSPEKCLEKALRYTGKGSIVIFHDSLKAMQNLQYALPRFLSHFTEKGYRFECL